MIQWRAYAASIQKLDTEMQGVNELVNRIYGGIEKEDDKEDY